MRARACRRHSAATLLCVLIAPVFFPFCDASGGSTSVPTTLPYWVLKVTGAPSGLPPYNSGAPTVRWTAAACLAVVVPLWSCLLHELPCPCCRRCWPQLCTPCRPPTPGKTTPSPQLRLTSSPTVLPSRGLSRTTCRTPPRHLSSSMSCACGLFTRCRPSGLPSFHFACVHALHWFHCGVGSSGQGHRSFEYAARVLLVSTQRPLLQCCRRDVHVHANRWHD